MRRNVVTAGTDLARRTAAENAGTEFGPALRALYAEYAVNAVGLVPHMVFLVDFVARGRCVATSSYDHLRD